MSDVDEFDSIKLLKYLPQLPKSPYNLSNSVMQDINMCTMYMCK